MPFFSMIVFDASATDNKLKRSSTVPKVHSVNIVCVVIPRVLSSHQTLLCRYAQDYTVAH